MNRVIPLAFLPLVLACGPKYLEGTQVPDTKENRVIADVIERYRLAVEHRDVAALKELVSRRYFSNAGTTSEPSDDYGYEQLERKVFPELRENIKSVQYSLQLRRVEITGERALAEFEFYYKFFYVDAGKDRWVAKNNFNRVELAREDGVWRITSGL